MQALYILQNKTTWAFWKVTSTTPLLQIRPVWLSQILTGKKLNDDNKRQGMAYGGIKGAKLFSPVKWNLAWHQSLANPY